MDRMALHEFCLSFAGAYEDFPFGDDVSVYKVMGKMFALIPHDADPTSISLKCDPKEALMLRQMYKSITPGYHLNKEHWNTILVESDIPDELIYDMIEDSYQLVVKKLTKKQRAELQSQSENE
jgi:predicted DNA-binding protein (MmcQ/YjbR family)